METGDAVLIGSALAVALGAVKIAQTAVRWLFERRNGRKGLHPYEEARFNKHLEVFNRQMAELLVVTRESNATLGKMHARTELETERWHNLMQQLREIQRGE
jgi:hypothetical protein